MNLWAILAGALVDVAGGTFVGVALTLVFMTFGWRVGGGDLPASFLLLSLLLGGACTVAGGWVAAAMARRSALTHSLLAGILSFGLAVPFLMGSREVPIWYDVAAYWGIIPVSTFGGWLYLTLGEGAWDAEP